MSARQLVLAFPGDLDTRTGGFLYVRRLGLELEGRGWAVDRLSLAPSFPFPSRLDLAHARERLAGMPIGSTVLVDGLALGAMPAIAVELASRLDLVALVHHPLCLETGLTDRQAAALADSERSALAAVRAVIVTSRRTAGSLATLMGVPENRITVALPGTDPAPLAMGSPDGICRMLCIGTVTPRKGQVQLVEALAGLTGKWELLIGGSLDRDPVAAQRLREAITISGLGDRVQLVGELSESALAARYAAADLFVSASLYEGYGMALAEALACGLPVVAVAGGAVVDTVPSRAGLLVPPGDVPALRAALRRCIEVPALREGLRRGAIATRATLPTWAETAATVEQALIDRRQ